MPTVKDVARHAGVSVGTVSKVLSKDPTVKPVLRDRVTRAVEHLGYKPNRAARALRTNRTDIIGLVVPDISNPFFAQLAKQIEAQTARHGHVVMLANSDDDPVIEARQVQALLDQSPRGLVVVGCAGEDVQVPVSSVPVVSVDRRYGSYHMIATDHEAASALVAEHLFKLGHRQVAYVSGPQSSEVGQLRKAGFCNRFRQLTDGLGNVALTVVEGQFDYASGDALARDLLSVSSKTRLTAIAAASDQQAIGALRAARDLGLTVPTDLSITGFDDIELARIVVPRLTTVSQRIDWIAIEAVHAVLGVENARPGDLYIDADLAERGSTASVRPGP